MSLLHDALQSFESATTPPTRQATAIRLAQALRDDVLDPHHDPFLCHRAQQVLLQAILDRRVALGDEPLPLH